MRFKRSIWRTMRRLELPSYQPLGLLARLIGSCERSAHYQNSTNQTPKHLREYVAKSPQTATSLLLDLSLVGLLVFFEISSADSTQVARARALSRFSNDKCSIRLDVWTHLSWPLCRLCARQSYRLLRFPSWIYPRKRLTERRRCSGLDRPERLHDGLAITDAANLGTQVHTLALALVLCSRLSTMPDEDGATSWAGFLETVDEDMIVDFETNDET